MSARPARVVDAHVHLWDPARTDWYPYLSGRQKIDLGDVTGMSRRFDVSTYLDESAGWNVQKLVNVAAATGRHSIDETLELDRRADDDGHPDAIIGGLPPTESAAEAIELIDRQMGGGAVSRSAPHGCLRRARARAGRASGLTGARPGVRVDGPSRPAPRSPRPALSGFDELVVVVEHTGWPRSATTDERVLWEEGMRALAALGDQVVCKLSGLAMPLGSMDADAFAPWIEFAIEQFGVDRCLFASNFPVDGMHGTFDDLYSAYAEVTAGLDDEARLKLFASNAERIYRC